MGDAETSGASTEPSPVREEVTNAFWNACRGGQQPVAEYPLDRGADLTWLGHDRKTPCNVGHEFGDDALIQWLRHAAPSAQWNTRGGAGIGISRPLVTASYP